MPAKARILIVEDSSTQAASLKYVLEQAGYQVDEARDGQQGLAAFEANKFDLVISDIVMPSMSGFELCQLIKKKVSEHNTPVVLLTALRELKDLIEGLRCGADNFITKPYEPSYLLQRVENIINNRHQGLEPDCDGQSGLCFMDKSFVMTLDRKRILEYLVSTFDDFLRMRHRESEAKLSEAQSKLQMITQKEQFLNTLGDNLTTPLTQNEKTLESLLAGQLGNLDPKQQEALAQLRSSNQALLELVAGLSESITKDEEEKGQRPVPAI